MSSSEIRTILNIIFNEYPEVEVSFTESKIILKKNISRTFSYYKINNNKIEYSNCYSSLEKMLEEIAEFLNEKSEPHNSSITNLDMLESGIIYNKYDLWISIIIFNTLNKCSFYPDKLMFHYLNMHKIKIILEQNLKQFSFEICLPVEIKPVSMDIIQKFMTSILELVVIIFAIPFFCNAN